MKKGFFAVLAVMIVASLIGGFIARERAITVKPRPIEIVTNDLSVSYVSDSSDHDTAGKQLYILNISSKKAHTPDCSGVTHMSEDNKLEYIGTLKELAEMGYEPCGTCKPK